MTCAVVCRAIMPRSVLLPTPDPEKMAIRCPLPIVKRALIGFYAHIDRLGDSPPENRIGRMGIEGVFLFRQASGPRLIDRIPHPVQHPSQKTLSHLGLGRNTHGENRIARLNSAGVPQGH